jgi:hypothetical protein
MKNVFLIIIFLFLSSQAAGKFKDQWIAPEYPGSPNPGAWICVGNCGDLPDIYYQRIKQEQSLRKGSCGYCGKSYNDKLAAQVNNFNKPRIFQAFCSVESEQNTSNIERKTSSEYWATYDGGLVNDESLKEFFSITKNQYSTDCDDWFSQYMKLPFHKTLIFAYDKNLIDVTGYWALSLSTYHRSEAERFGIQACENSHKSHNFESFNCAVLFTNSQIMNKEYLDLAKMSNKEYNEAITAYENKISEVRVSQSELSDLFN